MKLISATVFAVSNLIFSSTVWSVDMPPLAKKSNCTACHAMDKKLLGPSWMEISKKYKGVDKYTYKGEVYSLDEGLAMKVAKGGSGNWGTMPMPANSPTIKEADIKELVKFIIDLEKQTQPSK